MLSGFPDIAHARDCYKKALHDSLIAGHRAALSEDASAVKMSWLRDVEMKVTPAVYAADVSNTEAIKVNEWVSVTRTDCQRLGCKAEIVYLQMAFEHLPENLEWCRAAILL